MNNHFGLAFEGEMVVTNTPFVLEKFFINVFPLKDFLNWKNYLKNKVDSLSTYFIKNKLYFGKIFILRKKCRITEILNIAFS